MAGRGELYQREDGKYAFRVMADEGDIVATDGDQGYNNKADAKHVLEALMKGSYDGPVADLT